MHSKGDDALVTKNLTPGLTVYNEKRVTVEVGLDAHSAQEGEKKIEYRVWNPFRSKLGAAIVGGIENIYMKPGSKVLYLGAASGTTVSHVSDIVGEVWRYPRGLDWSGLRRRVLQEKWQRPGQSRQKANQHHSHN